MTHTGERPLTVVDAPPFEPPFDPEYDPLPGRRPPHDVDAEQAVLGALLLAPDLAAELATHLDGPDFYRPNHETIWNAIHQVATDTTGDIRVDSVTLAAHLARTGELQRIGGAAYLHTLMEACPLPANAAAYAKVVRDHARLRAIVETGTRLTKLGHDADIDRVDSYLGEALQTLDDTAMRFGPRDSTSPTGLHDLAWILTGKPPAQAPPVYCVRTDGHALFYPGKVNGIFGDPECGKTWIAQTAGIEALNAGDTFAMIDVDHNGPDHTAARLMLLGARLEDLADPEKFRYYEPEDADQLKAAVLDVTRRRPAVLVIDSLGEVLPMLGVKSVDNDEITNALRLVCTPPAVAGSCVITIDHLPKSAEARVTGYAIGGTAKKRIMRGSYIRAEARTQPAPGQIGRITLRIEKDTIGELRKVTPGGYAGTFVLDSTVPHVTTWQITRDDSPVTADGRFRPTHLMEAVSRHVETNDLCTFRDIKDSVTGADKHLRAAIKVLIEEGFLSVMAGSQRRQLHHSVAEYREAEDDQIQHDT